MEKYDFSGWATRNDLLCVDGRTIKKDAFKNQNGKTVPLVWGHTHSDPNRVLGHAVLENRDEGVYAYCSFNDSESGLAAKKLVKHGDVRSLSICAGQLKQAGANVVHGVIYELSLVLAGANPGAFIDSVMEHGDASEDRMIIGYDENIMIYHSADEKEEKSETQEGKTSEEKTEEDEETVEQIFDTLSEKQKNVIYAMFGQAFGEPDKPEDKNDDSKGGKTEMKHNVFDNEKKNETGGFLAHSAQEDITKTPQWVGKVVADVLNVRTWAGTNNPLIKSWPRLGYGNLVDVCDVVNAADGSRWYYIRIDGRIYGFVHSAYIEKT